MTREEAKAYIILHCNPDYPEGKTEWKTAINMAIKVLEQPEQRWIPCSERLPEEGQHCLACDCGIIMIDTFIGHGNPYNWKWYVKDYEAWMPLPEPYKEDQDEDR